MLAFQGHALRTSQCLQLHGSEDCDNSCFQITVAQDVDKVLCKFKGCQSYQAIMLVSNRDSSVGVMGMWYNVLKEHEFSITKVCKCVGLNEVKIIDSIFLA